MRDDCLMIQGCSSGAGKSVLAAGLCRLLARRGLRVVPFKPMNMSNQAAVGKEGGEMARAQALQALACGVEPSVDMNPVLIKPEGERRAELVLRGKSAGVLHAGEFRKRRAEWRKVALASFEALVKQADFVVVEGAGSPAEPNLIEGDIANMGFAEAADAPVWLVGDIDRGGVFAHLWGTLAVLGPRARRVQALVVNKFRGDARLLEDALSWLVSITGKPVAGVVPWLELGLPEEDGLGHLARSAPAKNPRHLIAAIVYPQASNLEDLDPLAADPAIELRLVRTPAMLAGADGIVLPGSKAVCADLAWLRRQGLADALFAAHRRGARIFGICGGMQMLGTSIEDPLGLEGKAGKWKGLGLLPITTMLGKEKRCRRIKASALWPQPLPVEGYEIHRGESQGQMPELWPIFAASEDRRVLGSYLHGIFWAGAYRQALLRAIGIECADASDHLHRVHEALDRLADALAQALDLSLLPERAR